ncbi:MAG TPA: hypothetical protein VE999_01685 [Gemmataceae bacterium]|nr:hypothetical protein [Bryobacteraceae bacterium]HZV03776.1 hypothetical protein [Gemmataceae bacterium]
MTDRDKVLIECQAIIRLSAALGAAIERLGEAINELIPPTAEEEAECDRIN